MTPTQPPGLRADERDPLYDDAYIRGVAVGFAADDSRRITLLRIADRVQARAALTPQPATSEERADLLAFLNGAAPLDGVWFGGAHPTERGQFWWRKRLAALAQPAAPAVPEGWKLVRLEPTKDMIEDGAQRLVSWEDGCTWPDSWSGMQVAAARNEAERVWRSMWLAAAPAAPVPAQQSEPVSLGRELFKFDTFLGWVNHAQRAWKAEGVRPEVTICIDAKGRPCRIGRDFMKARDDGAFPVRVYLLRAEDDPAARPLRC